MRGQHRQRYPDDIDPLIKYSHGLFKVMFPNVVYMYSSPIWHKFSAFVLICGFLLAALPATAQNADRVIIRDSETEAYLQDLTAPLLKGSQLHHGQVNLIIVQSSEINAFVAGGPNIFLYTGLLDETENPGELLGVIAHELGHISGGHLVGIRSALENASYESILGMVLGIGAAVATGNADIANAVIHGTQNIATRRVLAYSRLNENSADQAALSYLNSAGLNPTGLLSFMRKLQSQELVPASQQSEYIRTHPLTANRIEALRVLVEASPFKDKELPASWIERHERMKAKLTGFLHPGRVAWTYRDNDTSVAARYARAIAAYRQNNVEDALAGIDALILKEPQNPYFHEMRGQMLRDFGRVDQAVLSYKKAVDLAPDAGLIRLAYGHALLETAQNRTDYDQAIAQIQRALVREPRSSRAHRWLAIAYGRTDRGGEASRHLAEEALLQRRLEDARHHARAALQALPENSQGWLKARDILNFVDQKEDEGTAR